MYGSKGIQLDTAYEEFDPKRILLGLPHHELASSHDWSPVQQSNAIGHEYDVDRSSQPSHTSIGGCFQLAGACTYSVLAGPYSGKIALL